MGGVILVGNGVRLNLTICHKRHDISFETAAIVFKDEGCLVYADRMVVSHFQFDIGNFVLCGSAAPLCGKALPFRKRSPSELPGKAQPCREAELGTGRKGKAFPHKGAAEPQDISSGDTTDRIDARTGERRWHALGAVPAEPAGAAVLVVVHVYREEQDGEEIIRIISARAAEKNEVRRYQRQTLD